MRGEVTPNQLGLLHFDGKSGYLAMLFRAYLDESSDGKQEKVFMAAGFLATPKIWNALRKPWKAKLKEHRIAYFKSSDCRNLQNEFHKYRRELGLETGRKKAKEIRDELESIISDSLIVGFGMGVEMKPFKEISASPEANSDIWNPDYHDVAMQLVIHRMVQTVKEELPGHNLVGFVCDDGTKSDKINASYRAFKQRHPELAPYMAGISHLDDKVQTALQMADMMADAGRQMVSGWLDDPDAPVEAKVSNIFHVQCLREHGMRAHLRGEVVGL